MAKRRGQPQAYLRRSLNGKRTRIAERVRNWATVRLRSALGLPDLISPEGDRYVITINDCEAFAYLRRILQGEADLDPELYCCSPVTSNDEGDLF